MKKRIDKYLFTPIANPMNRFVLLRTLCILLFVFGGMRGASGGDLEDYLVNIEGWEAISNSEIEAAVGEINMVNAIKTYVRDEDTISAAIIITDRDIIVKQFLDADKIKGMRGISVVKIHGFKVYQFYERHEKSGAVSVLLADGETLGSVFTLSYSRISQEDALSITRQFDWQQMKEEVETYF